MNNPPGKNQYPWILWLDGNTHTIDLSTGSKWAGTTPRQIQNAAYKAARTREVKVRAWPSPDGSSITIRADKNRKPRPSKYQWDVLFNGKDHTIDFGPGSKWAWTTPRLFQQAAYSAARVRGIKVRALKSPDGTSVTIKASQDPTKRRRAKYPWIEVLDGNEHLIKLGPGTEWPDISARSVGVAARYEAGERGLTVHAFVSPDKRSIRIWAERPGGTARVFDWETWFDGNLHELDCSPGGYWEGISPKGLKIKIMDEAKKRRLQVRLAESCQMLLVQVVGQLPPK